MKKKPNVLFIFSDDLRPELNCYGCKHVISPNIDRLAATGCLFEKAYVQIAICNPSRASMLTGKRPDELSVWGLDTHFRETSPDVVTLPQHFKHNGYHTAAIGKIYHNDKPDPISWSEPQMHIPGYPYDPDAVYRDDGNIRFLEQRKREITEQEGTGSRFVDEYGQWYLKACATEMPDVPDITSQGLERENLSGRSEYRNIEESFSIMLTEYRGKTLPLSPSMRR